MRFTTISAWPRPPPSWRKTLTRMRRLHVTEIEQEEEYCLEAMLHWHDPVKRVRTLHRRRHAHTLVDDNPASG